LWHRPYHNDSNNKANRRHNHNQSDHHHNHNHQTDHNHVHNHQTDHNHSQTGHQYNLSFAVLCVSVLCLWHHPHHISHKHNNQDHNIKKTEYEILASPERMWAFTVLPPMAMPTLICLMLATAHLLPKCTHKNQIYKVSFSKFCIVIPI
jgi:hypothetical protein